MPFQLRWTTEAVEQYNALRAAAVKSIKNRKKSKKAKASRDEGLFKQVKKAIDKLQQDPKQSGLNSHQFSSMPNPFSAGQPVWESYAQNKTPGAYRIFWCYGPGNGELSIIAITPHP
jgi:hypothetical protein